MVFGGWINFDPYPQFLSAVPCSHVGVQGHGGFAKLSAADAATAAARRQRLCVPAGHLLVFNEKLMHEVVAAAPPSKTHTILRLFTGWRLTTSSAPLHGPLELDQSLAQQAICRLKSGQTPRMWPRMSWSQPGQRLAVEEWSVRSLHARCLHVKPVMKRSDPKLPDSHKVVHEQMASLADYGFELYHAYTDAERSLLYPRSSWQLTLPRRVDHDGGGGDTHELVLHLHSPSL